MVNNVRIGVRISLGFAVLLILFAFVTLINILSMREVNSKTRGMRNAKDVTSAILEARREEKNFIMRGGQEYVDKVQAATVRLNALVKALGSSGLSVQERSNLAGISESTNTYGSKFAEYVTAQDALLKAKAQWKDLGDRIEAAVVTSDRQLAVAFLLGNTAAALYLVDRSDDQWKSFEDRAAAFSAAVGASRGGGSAQLREDSAAYMAAISSLRALFRGQAQLESAMTDSGRGVIEAASRLESSLESRLDGTERLSSFVMLASAAGALLIGILVAFFLTRGITGPLRRGVEFAKVVAAGDLSRLLDINQRDEVGMLAGALNDMSVRLRDMVATIQTSSEQVAASSEEISAGAQSLAEGAQSQASTLEQTSASMEELTTSVDQVSEHAQAQAVAVGQGAGSMARVQTAIDGIARSLNEISELAAKSVANAEEGASAVSQVVQGITLIAESSEKIAGIVNLISDIADQTNLLALNASIGAARAGEHGRGFAVVAQEVSKLADRSSTSTKEIEALIRESAKNVSRGVEVARGSQGAMEQIRSASQKVKDTISLLTDSIRQQVSAAQEMTAVLNNVSEMSQSISAATEEQSVNSKQVARAVETVNELTQSAAASAEEMSNATAQLSSMAQQLQGLTGQFRIGEDGQAARRALPPASM